jgi:hypothetical protein
MENRDSIIRKLNALKAKANGASTPEEALSFANKYEELMEKYRLTETDLEIKNSKVESSTKTTRKETDKMELIAISIATLTDTEVRVKGKDIIYYGLPADLQYANWLYDLISDSLTTGYHKLPLTPLYHKLINNGVKGEEIKHNFKLGFLGIIQKALLEMIAAKKVKGNALVVLKNAIILQEIGEVKERKVNAKEIALYKGSHEAALHGVEEGSKVKLVKGVDNQVKGYIE